MPVDAIGVTPSTSQLSQASLGQEDFIRLFLTELSFQDPLEPVNNRDFLAQMAQFANLEQTRRANENTENLLAVSAANQALGLIGQQVQATGDDGRTLAGTVGTVLFTANGPQLTLLQADGSVATGIRLSQLVLARKAGGTP